LFIKEQDDAELVIRPEPSSGDALDVKALKAGADPVR
jgi:hypothetical protein